MDYIIKENDSGKTVKEVILNSLGISSAFLKHLKFTENGIKVNGLHATVRKILTVGDILSLETEDKNEHSALTPTEIPLDIIFEDDSVIVPNKPPFMPTHPSHLHHGDTLADALAYRFQKENTPFVFRPINRLDRNTSGAVLIAKNRMSAANLACAMKHGKIQKLYVAVLCGIPKKSCGMIETYMKRTEESIIVRKNCLPDEGGDYALTSYKVISSDNGYSLVLASPKTGRTHQLRVHFAGIGCPILGDDIYGREDSKISRHALHAIAVKFPCPPSHPDNESKEIVLRAPLFEDMKNIISELFGNIENEIYSLDFELI